MTVDELIKELNLISSDGNGHLPISFFANNHHYMSDEVNGRTTITLGEFERVDSCQRGYKKKFIVVGNYHGYGRYFTELLRYKE